jgi:adenylate cyclase
MPALRELLLDLLGSDGSLGDLPDRVRERTEGNPFSTEEVVQALVASGSLVGERGAYRLTAPIDILALPATVQSLLAARIDRLGELVKHVLQLAHSHFGRGVTGRRARSPQETPDPAR